MEKLPADLRPDEAMHVLHFLHAMPGTSALLKITVQPSIYFEHERNETHLICIRTYQNERRGLRESNHAEEELLKDGKNILDIIKGSISCFEHQNMNLNLEIFVNNSPCLSCTPKLLRFKQQISVLHGFTQKSLKFVVQFQHIYKPDKNRSSIGALRRGGIHVGPMKWPEFYESFLTWVKLSRSESTEDARNPTPPPPLFTDSSSDEETGGAYASRDGRGMKQPSPHDLYVESLDVGDTIGVYAPHNDKNPRNMFTESSDEENSADVPHEVKKQSRAMLAESDEEGEITTRAYAQPNEDDTESSLIKSAEYPTHSPYRASSIGPGYGSLRADNAGSSSKFSPSKTPRTGTALSPSRASRIGPMYSPSRSAPKTDPMYSSSAASWDEPKGESSDDSLGYKPLKESRGGPTLGALSLSEDSMARSASAFSQTSSDNNIKKSLVTISDDERIRKDEDIISHLYSVSKDWAVQFKLEQNRETRRELDSLV